MTSKSSVQRLVLGTFVRPAAETGTGAPRVEVACAYLVRHPDVTVLFDTGIGEVDPGTEAHYRPSRVPLVDALAAAGATIEDVDVVVNCHLHFDHCGGNALLAGRPVIAQRAELAAVDRPGHTIRELVHHEGAVLQEVEGEHEIVRGLLVVPTPGHTAGHQSLAVETDDGWVVLAGQAWEHASDATADLLATTVDDPLPRATRPAWLERLLDLQPTRLLLAQDLAEVVLAGVQGVADLAADLD